LSSTGRVRTIEVDDTEPTVKAVQRQIDALPDDPGGAAFNAAAHRDHPLVEMVDAPTRSTWPRREQDAESGPFRRARRRPFVRCVNPEREYLTWFYGVDGDDGELVDYHELDDFEAASIEWAVEGARVDRVAEGGRGAR